MVHPWGYTLAFLDVNTGMFYLARPNISDLNDERITNDLPRCICVKKKRVVKWKIIHHQ